MQLQRVFIGGTGIFDATAYATDLQQAGCIWAQRDPLDNGGDATACNTPATALKPVNDSAPAPAPDRWAWPHSAAMTTAEIAALGARVGRFAGLGVPARQAERLADRLVLRDREKEGRALCLECIHYRAGGRCVNAKRAGLADVSQTALPAYLAATLQRCDGFALCADLVHLGYASASENGPKPP